MASEFDIEVSAVICAKNEARSLPEVIARTKPYVNEILVIDGRSVDNTTAIAEKLGCRVIQDAGKGKGEAVRLGISACNGSYVVLLDADCSHDPSAIPALLRPLKEGHADLVVASRRRGGSDELDGSVENIMRDVIGRLITGIINFRFGSSLTDSQNGFRALRKEIIPLLELSEDGFTIEQQMIIRCLKRGLRVEEVSSREYKRKFGRSRISLLRHGPTYVWNLFKEMAL